MKSSPNRNSAILYPENGAQVIAAGTAIVPAHGVRGTELLLLNRQGERIIRAVAKENAVRKHRHERLLTVSLRVTTTFKSPTGVPAVTRSRTIKLLPLAATPSAHRHR